MELDQVCMTVMLENDEQLLKAIRRYGVLRTYPGAGSAHQRDLHARLQTLAKSGHVMLIEQGATTWNWRA